MDHGKVIKHCTIGKTPWKKNPKTSGHQQSWVNRSHIPILLMCHASLLTPRSSQSYNSGDTQGSPLFAHSQHSFLQEFPFDPIFLAGIISSDTDSKYCISLGFITLLYAIINPSEAEAYPKLAIRLDLRVFVCLVVCVEPLCVVPGEAEGFFFFFLLTHTCT